MLPEFLVGRHGNAEMKGFPVSLCPPLPLTLPLSVLGFTGLLEIASDAWGVLL